jgi:outer membrane phospholipase A
MTFKKNLFALITLLTASTHASNNLDNRYHPAGEKKLTSLHPNYFSYVFPTGDNELNDESHLEFLLSIQYPIITLSDHHRIYFSYNGLYDFYITEDSNYKSAPIISRRQNPGLTYHLKTPKTGEIQLGYFHESNGQTLEATDGPTAFNDLEQKTSQEYALTQVSRGWDYVSLTYRTRDRPLLSTDTIRQRIQLNLRTYMPKQIFRSAREDKLFWLPPAENATIADYDGLRLLYEILSLSNRPLDFSARIELKTGTASTDALQNLTTRITLLKRIFGIPLFAFYFNGYGKETSTYHLRTQYAGIGLEFR